MRFSVLMPVYNRAEYTRCAIDSILLQLFTDYEVIAVDDGSTDHAPQVLESYGARIKVFCQANRGVEAALNQAAAMSQGEYLCMLENDDLFVPHTLATYDRIIQNLDAPPLILGNIIEFRGDQPPFIGSRMPSLIKVRKYPDYLSKGEPLSLTNSRFVIRKSLFDELGGFGSRDGRSTDHYPDYNFMLKAGTRGPCVVVQEPCTALRRVHTSNFVRDFNLVSDGIFGMARSERLGLYPGGRRRRGSRYAVIGGFAFWWATTRFLRTRPKLAIRVLWGTAPMIAVALWRRILRCFRKSAPLIVLPAVKA